VLARSNTTIVPTDRLFQPDATGGLVTTLSRVISDQTLDCAALRLTLPVADEVLGIGKLAAPAAPIVGARVIKSGWKTGLSEGRVQSVMGSDVTIGRLPGYPTDYSLAGAGDSGAVWVDADTLAPVALHKRETVIGVHLAIATTFAAVLAALGLRQL
jgi:hypothetical protein